MTNFYEIEDNICKIKVTRRNGDVHYVLVDIDQVAMIEKCTVCVNVSSQIRAQLYCKGRRYTMLARVVMNAPVGTIVDHINHDPLDNRKSNLRVVTHQQNMQNRRGATRRTKTGARCVFWRKDRNNWQVRVGVHNKLVTVGTFYVFEEAVAAANEFIRVNLPFSTKEVV